MCVFTGQQAGFLGGPLLTLVKAIATVKAAALYSEQLGRPVVPIFWIAGDDHDFEEANHTWVLDRKGEPCKIAYTTSPEKEISTASIHLSDQDELSRAIELLKECLGETDFTPELFAMVDRCYTSEDTLSTAFGKFMAALMRDTGLVMFCPNDDEVKLHATPFFETIISRHDDL